MKLKVNSKSEHVVKARYLVSVGRHASTRRCRLDSLYYISLYLHPFQLHQTFSRLSVDAHKHRVLASPRPLHIAHAETNTTTGTDQHQPILEMAPRKIGKSYDRCTIAVSCLQCNSSLLDFHSPSSQELIEIARNRSIVVPSLCTPRKNHRLKSDYLAALTAADSIPSFPFMDLSPELRNRVYQEVLILDDSFTCFPQILATSKQINFEASTILYGDNLIDVRMFSDGVYVHGTKIGGMLGGDKGHSTTLSNLAWPAWLRKVQFLRFSLTHQYSPCGTRMFGLFRAQHLQNVLHSLCEFLGSAHVLRSL